MRSSDMIDEQVEVNQLLISALQDEQVLDLPEYKETVARLRNEKIDVPFIGLGVTSSSLMAGAQKVLDEIYRYLQERDVEANVGTLGSLGICSLEPLMQVQMPGRTKLVFHQVRPEQVATLLDGIFNQYVNPEEVLGQHEYSLHEPWEGLPYMHELPFFANQRRLIMRNMGHISPLSIDAYLAEGGYRALAKAISRYVPEEVCDLIDQAELRGRGGVGYCTSKKWRLAHGTPSNRKYLICNAGESDPGAFMERLLMESDPHQVLEGIAIAAYAIGAQKAYLYIESEYQLAIERLQYAIRQAYHYGLLGHDIMQSGINLDIVIKKGAGAYICGEETALISHLEGKRGMPQTKPPYPSEKGLFGEPTVVNNVETLVNVPLIMDKGADWYKSTGTTTSKGTKLFSLTGKIRLTGLVEIPMGTPLREVVYRIGDAVPEGKPLKALHLGGPAGGCVTEDNLDTPIDYESINALGATLGSGGIIVLDEDSCILDTVKYFLDFLKKESCGKCIPCREGIRRMHEIMEHITKRPEDTNGHSTLQRFKGVMQLENLAEVIRDTSLCGLGQRAANPVLSTLKWFRDEYEEHIFERNCNAGICQGLRTFEIDVEACTGCTLCATKCPTGAIFGTAKHAHFIVQEKCIGCGVCYETCKFNAVLTK